MGTAHRFLIVGAGAMGASYARMLDAGRVPGASLAGMVDLDAGRVARVTGELGVPGFTDLGAAIREVGATVAYVAVPEAWHRAPVEALAAAGIPMLVEKPLATTVEDGEAMVAAAAVRRVHAEVNYVQRWNPAFVEARRTVESGDLGEVRSFNACLSNRIDAPRDNPSWSRTTSPAWVLMAHCLDLAYWLSGRRAERVYATGGRGQLQALGIDTWDWVHAVVSYEGGGDGVFESSWVLPESWPAGTDLRLRVSGTHGSIDVNDTVQHVAVATQTFRYQSTTASGAWVPQRLWAFLRAVEGERVPRVSFADGLEVTRLLVAIDRSLLTGNPERP